MGQPARGRARGRTSVAGHRPRRDRLSFRKGGWAARSGWLMVSLCARRSRLPGILGFEVGVVDHRPSQEHGWRARHNSRGAGVGCTAVARNTRNGLSTIIEVGRILDHIHGCAPAILDSRTFAPPVCEFDSCTGDADPAFAVAVAIDLPETSVFLIPRRSGRNPRRSPKPGLIPPADSRLRECVTTDANMRHP